MSVQSTIHFRVRAEEGWDLNQSCSPLPALNLKVFRTHHSSLVQLPGEYQSSDAKELYEGWHRHYN